MQIRSESRISHPRDEVFAAYRDRLPELVRYLPDIREIRVVSREEQGGVVTLHNEWVSDRDVPAVASKVLSPDQLRWDDHATWNADDWTCRWTIRTRAFTDAVSCSGENRFLADGDGTRLVLTGDLTIDVQDIPGVPSFLARRIAPKLEAFIVSLVTPNLEKVNRSLQTFLDEAR